MPVIQAQDIVNAVIQDSQIQTTNRTALYDYTDRVQQRILRESQWRFLLSDPQTFVTMPGVGGYNLTNSTTPPGIFQTPLALPNFNNIAPGSVFNLTTWTKIEEDSDTETTLNYFNYRDGSLRYGYPRTYSNSLSNPGVITLKPVPDGQNQYYPVPETPATKFAVLAGCTLPTRTYYGVVTLVDSLGGESTQCVIPFITSIPATEVLTVQSPNPVPGGMSAGQVQYSSWNVYIGFSTNSYILQNAVPIPIGTNWTETIAGIATGFLPIPSTIGIPTNTYLSILPTGQLQATSYATPIPTFPYALIDSNNGWWELVASPMINTVSISPSASYKGVTSIELNDTGNVSTWRISVTTGGQLVSQVIATPPVSSGTSFIPPATTTIQPLNAYVIQFRYYMARNSITGPTDVLQIPYMYKDVVIAGVNYYASLYVNRNDSVEPAAKSSIWKKDFMDGLAQIRRDLRINYRKTDFISPDVVSQYVVGNQQGIPTMGW